MLFETKIGRDCLHSSVPDILMPPMFRIIGYGRNGLRLSDASIAIAIDRI